MSGKSGKGSERLLSLRGNVWWYRQQVPKVVHELIGGPKFLLINLRTADVAEAKRQRNELEVVTKLQFQQVKAFKRSSIDLPGWANRQFAHVLAPTERGNLARAAIETALHLPDDTVGDEEDNLTPYALAVIAAEQEAENLKPAQRKAFEDALMGHVDITHYLEAYLATAGLAPKTTAERRGLIGRFATWCAKGNIKLGHVDRKLAGRYVSEVIDPMHPQTQSKHLIALRTYWKFMGRRGHIQVPTGESIKSGWPWNDQQAENAGKRAERGAKNVERPFTDDEVRTLLYAPFPLRQEWETLLKDALSISLLSGMRQAEVLTLWVEEVHDGVFDIQQGKTDAAARKVPIHPALQEIVQRRLKDKGPKDWLFQEVQQLRDPGDTVGKRFKRFREALGITDNRDGVRRSLVNFHSARRWFTTKARHAGQPRETIADVIGHMPSKDDITFGVYAREASEAQRRACVEAVVLPSAGM